MISPGTISFECRIGIYFCKKLYHSITRSSLILLRSKRLRNHLPNMYGHTYSKSMDQPGKVASPARGQLNRKNECFPVRVHA